MIFDILTLFPEFFAGPLETSIIKLAIEKKIIQVNLINFRKFAKDKHQQVDDYLYGGGPGMLLKPEPIVSAVDSIKENAMSQNIHSILLCPQGQPFTQAKAKSMLHWPHLILICGHYKGFDERIRQLVVDEEISIGDYVLTGGEGPALILIEALTRLLPGVLGEINSAYQDSFSQGLLDSPHYTRPENFRGLRVPDVLLSGNHQEIAEWRREQSILNTYRKRRDLLKQVELTTEEKKKLLQLEQNV